jgi:hypothetical protein
MGIQWLAKPDLLPVRIPQVKVRVKNLFDKLKQIRKIILVGAPGFEPGPPAPKPAGLSPGSPSFSILVLKTKQLEKYLVVARRAEMCFHMHGVPRIFPIAK